MPTQDQVRSLLDAGFDYQRIGRQLGIPAGQVYLIATGRPADGGDSPPAQEIRTGLLQASSQDLVNPPHENPTGGESVREWIRRRANADAQMRAASAARTAEPAEAHPDGASTDVIEVLTRDHNQIRALMEQLEALPSHRTGGSSDDLDSRKSVVDMMTVRLSQHESAEEEIFWPLVRLIFPGGAERPTGDNWADQALAQEQEGKDLLTALGRLDPDTDEFDEHVERLVAALREHVAYEEQVLLALGDALDPAERERLGKRLLSAEKRAPTRPHKHAPKQPGIAVKAAGAGAAMVDKVRDAAGERPADRKGRAD